MDAALLDLLTDTVQLRTWTGHDSYGQPTYAAPVAHPARVEHKTRRLTTAQGQEVLSRCRVFLTGDVTVTLRDALTLDDGTSPAILDVVQVRDEVGQVHHWEILV